MIKIEPVNTDGLWEIAANMRLLDMIECAAVGLSPYEGLAKSVQDSAESYIFTCDNEPLGAFGAQSLYPTGATFWLLGTNGIVKHKNSFLRTSAKVAESFTKKYGYLSNYVYANNTASIGWLTWLGAEFADEPVKLRGLPFLHFELRR